MTHPARRNTRPFRRLTLATCFALPLGTAYGQISLSAAVSQAEGNSPRVKVAQADVQHARAALDEVHDAYAPAINAGAAIGQGYGYSPSPPTLFTVTSQSLVYSASQKHYILAARAALEAASESLNDVGESVAEDTAITFAALDHDLQRDEVFRQELGLSAELVKIVQERYTAGVDSRQDVTNAQLAAAQLRSRRLHAQDDTGNDREHLARLLGVPSATLTIQSGFPSAPLPEVPDSALGGPANDSVASAFSNARAKAQTAYGDTHFRYRPQLSLAAQYNRYATFTDSFKLLDRLDNPNGQSSSNIGANESAFGVQITLPLLDKARSARGRESVAEASRALHDAENAQISVLDEQTRLHHTVEELQADQEVARLLQQQSEEQLDVIRVQLAASSNGNGPVMTPKDLQNARLAERDRYISVLDSTFSLRQAEIQYLRQTGQLRQWLRNSPQSSPAINRTNP